MFAKNARLAEEAGPSLVTRHGNAQPELDEKALRAATDWLANAPPSTPRWHAKNTIRAYLLAAGGTGERARIDREEVAAKLADMRLYDDTGDPFDDGYMAAVTEFEEWLKQMAKERSPSPVSPEEER